MEELFSLLPTVVIFIFIFKKIAGIFEKIAEKNREIRDEDIVYGEPGDNAEQKNDIEKEGEISVADSPKTVKQITKNNDLEPKSNSKRKIENSINKKNVSSKNKEIQKKKVKNIFPKNEFTQEDIVKGFVFKQILAGPRAKRKWKPVNRD